MRNERSADPSRYTSYPLSREGGGRGDFSPVTKPPPVSIQLVFLYKLVSGIASSSFGTHVASLAGVPTTVVDRADVVSTDFAKQFKEKIEGRRKQDRLPLVLQADFAYLIGLVSEKEKLPGDKAKAQEVLRGLKEAVRMGLLHAARPPGVSSAAKA